jgi:hypothetical protein
MASWPSLSTPSPVTVMPSECAIAMMAEVSARSSGRAACRRCPLPESGEGWGFGPPFGFGKLQLELGRQLPPTHRISPGPAGSGMLVVVRGPDVPGCAGYSKTTLPGGDSVWCAAVIAGIRKCVAAKISLRLMGETPATVDALVDVSGRSWRVESRHPGPQGCHSRTPAT